MRHVLTLPLIVMLAALPAQAQEDAPSLLEDGIRDLFERMVEDMRPAVDDLSALVEEYRPLVELLGEEMAPALAEVLGQIDSITYYAPPVILPNGDIVMRRRPDAPEWVPPEDAVPEEDPVQPDPGKDGVIDL